MEVAVDPQYQNGKPQFTPNVDDEVWRSFFSAPESAPSTAMGDREQWKTEELLSEIVRRTYGDIPALRALQADVLQALLNAVDRQSAEAGGATTTDRT